MNRLTVKLVVQRILYVPTCYGVIFEKVTFVIQYNRGNRSSHGEHGGGSEDDEEREKARKGRVNDMFHVVVLCTHCRAMY